MVNFSVLANNSVNQKEIKKIDMYLCLAKEVGKLGKFKPEKNLEEM